MSLKSDKKSDGNKYNLYLEDRPTIKDEFFYSQIADSLKDTVKATNGAPTHISLMGEWGSGKSTVIELLGDKLDEKKDKIELKSFSVWKFSDNSTSLQRRIVRQVKQELGYDPSIPLGDKLYERTTSTRTNSISSILFAPFVKDKKIAIITAFLVFLQAFLLTIAFFIPLNWAFFSIPMIAILYSLLGFMGKSKLEVNISDKTATNPLEYDDQFEREFQTTIEKYTAKNKLDKLVLVFDDLDRLPPNQLYSALNTIKTFLNSKRCVFIVPCDERVLRSELEYVFDIKKFKVDVSEFLNKTFDIIVKLPMVERQNMRKYANTLLINENIEWYHDEKIQSDFYNILSILIHSDIDTPRKVKKNLNAFASDWYLAKRRDSSSGYPILTNSPKEIAIMSVLKSNYLNFYEILQVNPIFFRGVSNIQELEEKIKEEIKEINIIELSKDRNAYPFNSNPKESFDTDELEVSDFVSIDFLSRVLPYLPDDVRTYLYFTNNKLNPITTVKELNNTKEALLNGDSATFGEYFNSLSEENRFLLLNNMGSELYGEMDEQNTLSALMNNPGSALFTKRTLQWEELTRKHIEYLVKNVELKKIYNFINRMDAKNVTWQHFSDIVSNTTTTQDVLDLWVEFPDAQRNLKISNINEAINSLNRKKAEKNRSFDISKLIFSLSIDHPLIDELDWKSLLIDSVSQISKVKKNREEIEIENSDYNNDIEKASLEFGFTLIDWIETVNEKTNQIIDSKFLYDFIPLIEEWSNSNFLRGVGEYWEEYLIKTVESDEIKILLEFLFHNCSYLNILFSDDIFTIINNKYKDGVVTEDVEYHSIDDLLSALKYEGYTDVFMSALEKMKDIKYVSNIALHFYKDDDDKVNNIIEDVLIYNDHLINLEGLFKKLNEKMDWKQNKDLKSIKKLITSSEIICRYGMEEGYLDNWFLDKPNNILNIDHKNISLYIDIRSYFEAKKDFTSYLIETIIYLLENAHQLETNGARVRNFPYRNQWKEHLGELFIRLLKIGGNVDWSKLLTKFTQIKQMNNSTSYISLFDYLDSALIEQSIQLINSNSPLNNKKINELIMTYGDFENELHIKPIVHRWLHFSQNQRNQVVDEMTDAFYKKFIEEFKNKLKHTPKLSYINQLKEEYLEENDKESIVNTIITYSPIDEVNIWINEMFSSNITEFDFWEHKAFDEIIRIHNSLNRLGYTFIRDALTVKNNRTEVALKLIPLMYNKKDAKDARKHIRELILNLERHKEFSELATIAKRIFNWKNR